jgi:hypothetical protein
MTDAFHENARAKQPLEIFGPHILPAFWFSFLKTQPGSIKRGIHLHDQNDNHRGQDQPERKGFAKPVPDYLKGGRSLHNKFPVYKKSVRLSK